MQQDEVTRIDWHSAFYEAIQMELAVYSNQLEFHIEVELTAEPLKIDCVVIKKEKNLVIKKNIAAIFREWNILEYKSPDDYVSVSDFLKVYGYACLYASLKKIPITGMTISFIESRYPEKLLKYLKNVHKYTVEETAPGIYTVIGNILPIQVIDSRQLPAEENLWVKSLSNRLKCPEFTRISTEIIRQKKEVKIQAYINAILLANAKTVEEAIKMSDVALTLDKVLEDAGYIARWEAIGETRGVAMGEEYKALSIAQNMANMGFPFETITAITGLNLEKVKSLCKKG
jgi:hypothetical protein